MCMKTRCSLMIIGLGAVLLLLAPGLPPAAAQGGGAQVYNGEDGVVCFIDLEALTGSPGTVTTTDYHAVVTPSGNTVLKCTADLPSDVTPPRHTLVVRGERCITRDYRLTYDMQKIYTPNGKVQLVCHINGQP